MLLQRLTWGIQYQELRMRCIGVRRPRDIKKSSTASPVRGCCRGALLDRCSL